MIKDSVGNAARNLPQDVEYIRKLILSIQYPHPAAPHMNLRRGLESKDDPVFWVTEYLANFQRNYIPSEKASQGRCVPYSQTLAQLHKCAKGTADRKADAILKSPVLGMGLPQAPAPPPEHWLTIRDVRLKGYAPRAMHLLEVNFDTPLSWPILWVTQKARELKGSIRVRLMAHGIVTPLANGKYSQGGYGMEFCKEGINLDTLSQFSAWAGLIRQIDLFSCGVAYITPGFEGKKGDGNFLCSRLAQTTKAAVRASTATQTYFLWQYNSNHLDFGQWEGTVLTYNPDGSVKKVEHAPAA